MNYIDLLTQEEKSILCGIITGRDFKELFKRNEREFSKIRKGFRAKSLTEQQALSIAIANLGTANYVRHDGSRPMNITWRLDRPIPAKFLKKTNKLVVG